MAIEGGNRAFAVVDAVVIRRSAMKSIAERRERKSMKSRFTLIGALTALAVVGTLVLPAGAASGLSQTVSALGQLPAIVVDQPIAKLCLNGTCEQVTLKADTTGSEIGITFGYSVNPSAALPSIEASAPMAQVCTDAGSKGGVAITITGGNFAGGSSLTLAATQNGEPVGNPVTVPAATAASDGQVGSLCLL